MSNLTIDDLARLANVSIKTISRVLNNEVGVGAKKRAEIQKLIDETGYVPNASARGLASARSYLIGMIISEVISHYYLHELQVGVMRACQRAGYHLIIEAINDVLDKGKEHLKSSLASSRFDGVVIVPPSCDDPLLLDVFQELKVPMIRVAPSKDMKRTSYVFMDDEKAAYELTRYLVGIGHTRIAFIENIQSLASNIQRKAGYLRALLDCGIEVQSEWIVGRRSEVNDGFDDAVALLSQTNRPTAVFGAADFIALGAMAAASKLGLRVPDDVSIVGFDDSPAATSVWPRLTTIHQPIALMAETATDMLIGTLGGDLSRKAIEARQMAYHLVERQSAAAPRAL